MMAGLTKDNIPSALLDVCRQLGERGGEAWLVGGCVRDLLRGQNPKDWDIEVYQLEPELLFEVLTSIGSCEQVGKQFGVIKLWFKGLEIDVALPRTEKKVGVGHKGFDVRSDPFCSQKKATLRRDFTINAMMFEPLNEVFYDFHDGVNDLKQCRLQHVSNAFVEDPLRPLRAVQFAGRFKLTLAPDTAKLCRQLRSEAATLASSRVWQEWLKWAGSCYPSFGLRALKDMGWLSVYPELEALVDCPQHKRWHPEGDVWRHTCLVVDQAAKLRAKFNEKEGLALMFAALCHDFGKPLVTFTSQDGEVLAPGHSEEGVKPAQVLLRSISVPKHIVRMIVPLIQQHVAHFEESCTYKNVSWLAYKLEPTSIRLWEALTRADAGGCDPLPALRPALSWLRCAQDAGISEEKAGAIVTGNMLLKIGVGASSVMGKVIKGAYKAQLNGEFNDEETAYIWLKKYGIASVEK